MEDPAWLAVNVESPVTAISPLSVMSPPFEVAARLPPTVLAARSSAVESVTVASRPAVSATLPPMAPETVAFPPALAEASPPIAPPIAASPAVALAFTLPKLLPAVDRSTSVAA